MALKTLINKTIKSINESRMPAPNMGKGSYFEQKRVVLDCSYPKACCSYQMAHSGSGTMYDSNNGILYVYMCTCMSHECPHLIWGRGRTSNRSGSYLIVVTLKHAVHIKWRIRDPEPCNDSNNGILYVYMCTYMHTGVHRYIHTLENLRTCV